MRFADTNILLYAVSTVRGVEEKSSVATTILSERDIVLSTQVLQEFYVQATRASRTDRLTHQQAADLMGSFLRFKVQPVTVPIVFAAASTSNRFGISYWDAAIIEAARVAGCEIVLSEDLNDGQSYGDIVVRNPFV